MLRRFILYTVLVIAAFGVMAAQVGAKKKTLIVALGDSLTAGAPYFRSPLEAFPEGEGNAEGQYAYWIMRKKPQWDVKNFGISGETTSQIRARIDFPLRSNPRYVVILAGANDIYQGLPVKAAAANLFWMYEYVKSHSAMPVAVTVPPFNRATPEQAESIDVLNRWILQQAEKLRIPVADANLALRDPNDPHKLSGSTDGLHPDIPAYRKLGHKIIEAIAPIEKAWR